MSSERGQASVSYMLVVAVLAIAIGAILASETMRQSFSHLYAVMAERIMGPH